MFLSLLSVVYRPSNPLDATGTCHICNGSVYGNDVCGQRGLGLYSSYNGQGAPSSIVVWSKSVANFTSDFCTSTLGMSSSQLSTVSPKFTGLFTAPSTDDYELQGLFVYDASSTNGYYSLFYEKFYSPIVEIGNVSSSSITCAPWSDKGCYTYRGTSNCLWCVRKVSLEANVSYPLYAGIGGATKLSAQDNLYMQISFNRTGDPQTRLFTVSNTVVGFTASTSNSTASSSSSKSVSASASSSGASTAPIAGVAAGCVLLIVIVAAAIFAVIKKRKSSGSEEARGKRAKGSRRGGDHARKSSRRSGQA